MVLVLIKLPKQFGSNYGLKRQKMNFEVVVDFSLVSQTRKSYKKMKNSPFFACDFTDCQYKSVHFN